MPTGRTKEKYNAKPTAREKAFHIWLMENYPCACGCGGRSTVVHHPLRRHPDQRWRRDHEFVVPMVGQCHMDLHAVGNEVKYRPNRNLANMAEVYRGMGYSEGVL